ncbi:universal stress protein [Maribacter cobaltidurans]|uniref:Uncharacterized protein n=1 Tax=Maribacter cobaltidurans TaxID=1178778 RepID=A0A223V667_9FLAO|nr:universal stress protein [Maribacter cobaltidurans]ASV30792.1 hypothetical protein CJ263_11515 [Maribacter cobaltidurans]GGD81804.1 hypothetical protein GCM10011412_19480 [Maribacter cobaltidurans]
MQINKILVTTDFSNEAYNALFYATQLFAKQECEFYILNVYDRYTPIQNKAEYEMEHMAKIEKLKEESVEGLTKTYHKINLDVSNVPHKFKTLSKRGKLSQVVRRTIDLLDIGLVIMGNKGKTGAKEIFMGSNTLKVASTLGHCPLLAIPKEVAYIPIKEIAFITDFKKGCNLKTLAPLLSITKLLNAYLKVFHLKEEEFLNTVQESNRKLLEMSLKGVEHDFEPIHEFSSKAKVIDSFIKNRGIHLFSTVYTKKGFLERMLHEPVIKDLSMYTSIPFLVLPNRD